MSQLLRTACVSVKKKVRLLTHSSCFIYMWNKSSPIVTMLIIQLFVCFDMAQWCCYSQLHVEVLENNNSQHKIVRLTKTCNAKYLSCLFLNCSRPWRLGWIDPHLLPFTSAYYNVNNISTSKALANWQWLSFYWMLIEAFLTLWSI